MLLETQEIECIQHMKKSILEILKKNDSEIEDVFYELKESGMESIIPYYTIKKFEKTGANNDDIQKILNRRKITNLFELMYANNFIRYNEGNKRFSISESGEEYLIKNP